MNTFLIILGLQISLAEIIIFQVGAIVLGFSIHFFWSSRKNIRVAEEEGGEAGIAEADEWRLKYYEQMDEMERLADEYRDKLDEDKQREEILREELELMRREKERLTDEQTELAQKDIPAEEYLSQLQKAQENMLQHNQHISRLLEQINSLKESEKKYSAVLQDNEQLNEQIRGLRKTLYDKESEIRQITQQQVLAREVKDRLEKAYGEFNLVQEKIQKVESQLVQPHSRNFEYEELQQSYFKLTKEFDEVKLKYVALMEENQRLTRLLADTEDKLREANFQRQQLHKKVGFLEELNNDLQQVSEHNKKLEGQLRRIGEIETLLARLSGSRPSGPESAGE